MDFPSLSAKKNGIDSTGGRWIQRFFFSVEAKEMPKLEELAHATEETLVDVLGFPEQDGTGTGTAGSAGRGWGRWEGCPFLWLRTKGVKFGWDVGDVGLGCWVCCGGLVFEVDFLGFMIYNSYGSYIYIHIYIYTFFPHLSGEGC